jgi:hypothetical protein
VNTTRWRFPHGPAPVSAQSAAGMPQNVTRPLSARLVLLAAAAALALAMVWAIAVAEHRDVDAPPAAKRSSVTEIAAPAAETPRAVRVAAR